MKQALYTMLLLLDCGVAVAESWESIGKTTDRKTRVYIETSGIQIEDGVRRGWIRDVFKPHTKKGIGPQPDLWVNYVASHVVVNCTTNTYVKDALIWYYEDGTSIKSPPEQISALWTAINPAAIADHEMRFLCDWNPNGAN
jgi:hypothetical protein